MATCSPRRAASPAATYFKVLKLLCAWLAEEAEIPADPMVRMKRPIVPDKPVPIVAEDGRKRLFRACAGNTFEGRRDTALLMLLLDTGARRAEMVGPKSPTWIWSWRCCWCSARAAASVPCWLAAGPARRWTATCASHPRPPQRRCAAVAVARKKGRLTGQGLRMMLRRRGAQVGLPGSHPHQLRTSSATPSRTSGLPRVARRATSCGSPAGSPAPCSSGTVPLPPTLALARRIAGSPLRTGWSSPVLIGLGMWLPVLRVLRVDPPRRPGCPPDSFGPDAAGTSGRHHRADRYRGSGPQERDWRDEP
jgi:hypothetical protein